MNGFAGRVMLRERARVSREAERDEMAFVYSAFPNAGCEGVATPQLDHRDRAEEEG